MFDCWKFLFDISFWTLFLNSFWHFLLNSLFWQSLFWTLFFDISLFDTSLGVQHFSVIEFRNHQLTTYRGNFDTYTQTALERYTNKKRDYDKQQSDISHKQQFVDKWINNKFGYNAGMFTSLPSLLPMLLSPYYRPTCRLIAPCSLISGHLFNNAVQVLCNLGWKKSQKWRKTVNNTLKNRYPLAVASVSGFPPRTPTSATRWLPFNACRSVTPPPRP